MKYIFLLLITSCATVVQERDPKVYYKRDMRVEFNDKKYHGVAVLPNEKEIEIEFKSSGKLDLFTFTTCHREIALENEGNFLNSKKIAITYKPHNEIESLQACPIEVAGYDIKGKHSFAFLEMQTVDATLPALIRCDGKQYQSQGVTICQSREGLHQEVIFDVEVIFSPEAIERPECKNIEHELYLNKRFKYKTPNRECVYVFTELTPPYKRHRLYTIGYEDILIKEL